MENIRNDFNKIKEGESTALRELSIEIATKEGAKSYNKNGKLGLAIAYIITELSVNGQMKDIRREDIEGGSTASKTDTNGAVKKLVDKGLVKKYKKVNQVVDKRKNPTGKFRFDKYVYTLIATDELINMIEAKDYTVAFDRSILSKLQAEAAAETEKVTSVIKVDRNGVVTTDNFTTDARGNRTKSTEVNMDSVEQAMENAREEYENKVAEIKAAAEQDGKEEELSPVNPLVSQEDILNMDMEEFRAEQQEEPVEEVVTPTPKARSRKPLTHSFGNLPEEDEIEDIQPETYEEDNHIQDEVFEPATEMTDEELVNDIIRRIETSEINDGNKVEFIEEAKLVNKVMGANYFNVKISQVKRSKYRAR